MFGLFNNVKDPVCKMKIDPDKIGVNKKEYQNRTYYFCSESCKEKFSSNPKKYLEENHGGGCCH